MSPINETREIIDALASLGFYGTNGLHNAHIDAIIDVHELRDCLFYYEMWS